MIYLEGFMVLILCPTGNLNFCWDECPFPMLVRGCFPTKLDLILLFTFLSFLGDTYAI